MLYMWSSWLDCSCFFLSRPYQQPVVCSQQCYSHLWHLSSLRCVASITNRYLTAMHVVSDLCHEVTSHLFFPQDSSAQSLCYDWLVHIASPVLAIEVFLKRHQCCKRVFLNQNYGLVLNLTRQYCDQKYKNKQLNK